MRYELMLRREDGKHRYLGRADNRTHAREWAKTRLRKTPENPDVRYGDRVELIPVGKLEAVEIID